MKAVRNAIDGMLGSRTAGALFRPLMRGRATIFMLHRFRVPELGIDGHDPAGLRQFLGTLRREGTRLIGIEDLFAEMATGHMWGDRVVAFTIDDGYFDQATVGADAFAEFDCPVTTFVTSGFLDGAIWCWWDRIAFVFGRTALTSLTLSGPGTAIHYRWTDAESRRLAQNDFTNRCKVVPEHVKLAAIDALAAAAEVDVPTVPPPAYAPMSWSDLRRCELRGMRFGPHTVTHPVLSMTDDEQSHFELTAGWGRLSTEARNPSPIFCYPNGQLSDFGERELRTLQALGINGGVVGRNGYASPPDFNASWQSPYLVPRFAYEGSRTTMMQIINGIEHAKRLVRSER